jgi:integrase
MTVSARTWGCAERWICTTCVSTFATRSIPSGTDVTILQKILGHSEIGMTMRYVKIAEHYKVEAVEKLEKYRAVQMQEVEKGMGMIP